MGYTSVSFSSDWLLGTFNGLMARLVLKERKRRHSLRRHPQTKPGLGPLLQGYQESTFPCNRLGKAALESSETCSSLAELPRVVSPEGIYGAASAPPGPAPSLIHLPDVADWDTLGLPQDYAIFLNSMKYSETTGFLPIDERPLPALTSQTCPSYMPV